MTRRRPLDFGANDWLIDYLREAWLEDPGSVSPAWAAYFSAASAASPAAPPAEPPAAPPAAPRATSPTTPPATPPAPPPAAPPAAPPTAPLPAAPPAAPPEAPAARESASPTTPTPPDRQTEPSPPADPASQTTPTLPARQTELDPRVDPASPTTPPPPAPPAEPSPRADPTSPTTPTPLARPTEPSPHADPASPTTPLPDRQAEPSPPEEPASPNTPPPPAPPVEPRPHVDPASPLTPTPPARPAEPSPRADAALVFTPLAPDQQTPFSPDAPAPLLPVSLGANPPDPRRRPTGPAPEAQTRPLKRAELRTARVMEESLDVPTATSVRTVPMRLAIDLREELNQHLAQTRGGKVSFTHIVGFAMVEAIQANPALNAVYTLEDGRPAVTTPGAVNLGLAVDVAKPDGSRQLLVPNIKQADTLDFNQFVAAYDDVVRRAQRGGLTADDLAGTTCTLTNPGTLGTGHSVPRLMAGQGVILGVGAIAYAPGFFGASPNRLNDLGIGKVMTLTSTYDHRVIQGAQSGEFLAAIEERLTGGCDFYARLFTALRVPYAPLTWADDIYTQHQDHVSKTARVAELIDAYRSLGHLMADTDPLLHRLRTHPDLELAAHGLTLWDLDREFAVGALGATPRQLTTLRHILQTLRDAYCRTVGVEYMHILDPAQRAWLRERLEVAREPIAHEEHMRILDRLNEAELFETFLQTKFVGQKRFSLEGGESAIVAIDQLCEQAAVAGLDEVCVGMPHRGRLNVLANIIGKSYSQIFQEFDEHIEPGQTQGTGDVKYHLGAEGFFKASTGATIKTSVAANPSHLETVDPVLEGIARAKQDRSDSRLRHPVLPVLVHGDAAFAGQGVVYEVLQMSQLPGYATGGTVHLVVNNQIGFTTAPSDSRSSTYCTDVAKAVQAPVFHVNGDDPDAVVRVARLAFAFRQAFAKDVVIDLVCYRRRGHNEGDDPSFTQPLMYDLITQKRPVRELYTEALIGRGDISEEDAASMSRHFRARLEARFAEVREAQADGAPKASNEYLRSPAYPPKPQHEVRTAIEPATMELVAASQLRFPEGFQVHPKVLPQLERRADRIRHGPIDWTTAELLALGSLLADGIPVRLTGQDTRRGTFSQRFGAITDRATNWSYVPLKHLHEDQAPFDIFDSLLSEYAALGFEYGYSVAASGALVCWEAQFGDFANTAQAVIDEFIAAGSTKWSQQSGVVLLLPHGMEGQGPDHSSARLERWLQLCSEDALAVCQPSTPASYFHLLRAHALVYWHRPLVVATPKWMLRHPKAVSQPAEFTSGEWRHALGDPTIEDPARVRRVLLCSGKIRWELDRVRSDLGRDGEVAIVTLERLYPLPTAHLAEELAQYAHVADFRYVQDEPGNQGAWWHVEKHLPPALLKEAGLDIGLVPVTRPPSSAPATGSHRDHEAEQRALLEAAVG